MLNKKLFIIFLILSGLLSFSFPARATIISQIYFTDFVIEKADFTAGEEIKGNFTLWNYEKQVVPDITYSYKLLAQDSSGFYTIVLDEKFSGDNFSLKPDQKVTKPLSYYLPHNLPSGNHRFRVQLFNSKGLPMSRKDADITVSSDDKFLILENHFLLKNREKLSPAGAVTYDAGQVPEINFDILNKSSFQISASPRIVLYYYNITENPLRVVNKQSITLKPGELQNKTFDLIDFKESGNYVCRLALYYNNEVISNSIDFRWKISGKEAEVAQVKLDDTSYQEGDEAKVVTDMVLKEAGGELQVTIYDEDGKIVGEKKEVIDSKGGRTEVKVPMTGDVVNPRLEIAVLDKDQKTLDRYEAQVEGGEISKEEKPKRKGAYLITGILIVMLIFMIYIWRKSNASSGAILIIAFVFSGILLLINPALAVESISYGPDSNTAISWSAPLPEYLYEEGKYVSYSGHIQTISLDPLRNNTFEFFIAEINKITTTTHPIIPGIEIIDQANSEVIKLGELALPDEFMFVDYEKPVQLPSDLADNYLGEAWLCVQFMGENVNTGDWHWYVACQEVTVQPEGEGCLYLELLPDEAEAGVGEQVIFTIKANSKCPCIVFPIDLIQIIDVSESMNRPAAKPILNTAKNAAKIFANEMMIGNNTIGLVSYSDSGNLVLSLTSDISEIESKINGLAAEGCTCISCGIMVANQDIINNSRPEAVRHALLMTDGVANKKIDGSTQNPGSCPQNVWGPAAQEARDYAHQAKSENITIHTVTFKAPASAVKLMKEVADITGGEYFDAPDEEDLEGVYKTIAGLLLGESPGTKLKINIPGNFNLIDYDSRCSYGGTTLTCDMGDLACGGTNIDPFQFTLELVSGSSGQDIEVKATIENDLSQKKEDTAVVTVSAPNPPIDLGIAWDHCNFVFGELSVPIFRWETSVPHTGYNIEIYGATADVWVKEVSLSAPSLFSSYAFIANPIDINWIRNNLLWGGTYDWRVKIKENGQWSDWSWGQVTMPDHSYPRPDFSHFPQNPPAGEIVTFTDKSKCYFSPGNVEHDCEGLAGTEYAWDFDYNPPVFNVDSTQKGNVTTTFSQSRNYTVGLRITDNTLGNGYFGNNYCIGTGDSPVGVTFPLPEYREVAPIGRLDNFLARLINVFTGF